MLQNTCVIELHCSNINGKYALQELSICLSRSSLSCVLLSVVKYVLIIVTHHFLYDFLERPTLTKSQKNGHPAD